MQANNNRKTFYLDELSEWGEHIDYYHQECAEIESKLYELIRRNSIPDIAAMVEARLEALSSISAQFITLEGEIAHLEELFSMNGSSNRFENGVDASTERRQDALRNNMQAAEKNYIDTRYECHQFLSDMLKP